MLLIVKLIDVGDDRDYDGIESAFGWFCVDKSKVYSCTFLTDKSSRCMLDNPAVFFIDTSNGSCCSSSCHFSDGKI